MIHKLMTIALGGVLAAGAAMSASYAEDQQNPSQQQAPSDRRDMMGQGGMPMMDMMAQMNRMMENCNKMMESHMQDHHHQGEQPDKKG